jgi:hypothetical protein
MYICINLNISGASFLRILSIVRNKGFVKFSFDHDNKLSSRIFLLNKLRLCIFTFNISDSNSFIIDENFIDDCLCKDI